MLQTMFYWHYDFSNTVIEQWQIAMLHEITHLPKS